MLIFGGTTEGRIAARVADEAGKPFYYSTKSELQQIDLRNGQRMAGAMQASDIQRFIAEKGIRLVVDAAHPFAQNLHAAIASACTAAHIPVVRYERDFSLRHDDAIYCRDFSDAITQMERSDIHCLLALSGANTISRLKPYWLFHKTFFRILHRPESIDQALRQQFPLQHLVFYGSFDSRTLKQTEQGSEGSTTLPTLEAEMALMRQLGADAILTKESGSSGGTDVKVEAARRLGLKIFIVERPASLFPLQVTGPHGLRRTIERLLPDFFPLRTGLTTGACATAAAHAALHLLLTGEELEEAAFMIPDGEMITVPIESLRLLPSADGMVRAESAVVKDAGDDPDVTNGCCVRVVVSCSFDESDGLNVDFHAGSGVGTVTLPGLGIDVGGPAINPTPRRMITDDFRMQGARGHFDVTIGVDGGEELAQRTFNPKVGVVGGISIIGTSGIVRPLSNEAFVESIGREVDVALAIGVPRIVINSGAKSESFVRSSYPDLPSPAFIHYGNFIGDTLQFIAAKSSDVPVTLGLMIGKAVKLAEGHLDTHSHKVVMNKDFLLHLAIESGCSVEARLLISQMTLARQLWTVLSPSDLHIFVQALLRCCLQTCSSVFPLSRLTIYLISESGTIFTQE